MSRGPQSPSLNIIHFICLGLLLILLFTYDLSLQGEKLSALLSSLWKLFMHFNGMISVKEGFLGVCPCVSLASLMINLGRKTREGRIVKMVVYYAVLLGLCGCFSVVWDICPRKLVFMQSEQMWFLEQKSQHCGGMGGLRQNLSSRVIANQGHCRGIYAI